MLNRMVVMLAFFRALSVRLRSWSENEKLVHEGGFARQAEWASTLSGTAETAVPTRAVLLTVRGL